MPFDLQRALVARRGPTAVGGRSPEPAARYSVRSGVFVTVIGSPVGIGDA